MGRCAGAIAAMAMTGMRSFTVSLGLVEEPPPRAILRQKSKGLFRLTPKRFRRAAQELFHWGYGAAGGAAFALLPRGGFACGHGRDRSTGSRSGSHSRRGSRLRSGSRRRRSRARSTALALAADHLLYGFVLSELRRRPRE